MNLKKCLLLSHQNKRGTIAQLVEQRTENPCVPGSTPGGTTPKGKDESLSLFLLNTFIALFPISSINS